MENDEDENTQENSDNLLSLLQQIPGCEQVNDDNIGMKGERQATGTD